MRLVVTFFLIMLGSLNATLLVTQQDRFLLPGMIYLGIIIMTFPSILSKVIFRGSFFEYKSALLFLVYPVLFLISIYISKAISISPVTTINAFILLTYLYWHYLVAFYIFTSSKETVIRVVEKILYALVVFVFIGGLVFVVIRQPFSILATDSLQHQAVVNQMVDKSEFCLMPNDCSNIFLKVGYTSFYHTVLGSVTLPFYSDNLDIVLYAIDIVWLLFSILVIFNFLSRHVKQPLAFIVTTIAMLVFMNGAYGQFFFIPQTFALMLFFIIMSSQKLQIYKLALASILLISTHLIIGAYLFVLLLVYAIVRNFKQRGMSGEWFKYALYSLLSILALVVFVHANGFSIESAFQSEDVLFIGSDTNPGFPGSIEFIIGILGIVSVFGVFALLWHLVNSDKQDALKTYGLAYVIIALICYFLGPTYAHKFLIGSSVFIALLLTTYIVEVIKLNWLRFIVFLTIIMSLGFTLIINYDQYQNFYKQDSGSISAVTDQDITLVEYLNSQDSLDCTIVSDPYTQLMIVGFTKYETANGHYMSTNDRKTLIDFTKSINEEELEKLIQIDGLQGVDLENLCFVYNSRIDRTINENEDFWIYNVYSYLINNDYELDSDKIKINMKDIQFESIFETENIILFRYLNLSNVEVT